MASALSIAMDMDPADGPPVTAAGLNIARPSGGPNSASQLSEVMSTFRPTKLFHRTDVKDGRPPPRVLSLDFDDPGELLMTSESDETIQIYSVREGIHNKTLLSKKYGAKLARFTHSGSSTILYASTRQNDAIRYLATHDNTFIRYFEGHEGRVSCLAMHPGHDNFISCSQDNTVRLWNVSTRQWVGQLFLHTPYLAAYDPSGTIFAVACPASGCVLLYDCRNFDKAPFATFDIVESCMDTVTAAAIGGGGGGGDHQQLRQALVRGWTKLEFSNDGKFLLLGTRYAGHFLLDAFDGSLKALLRRPDGGAGTRRSPPGELSQANVGASTDPAHYESSADCCFSVDGRFVLGGSAHKNVAVWDVKNASSSAAGGVGKIMDPAFVLDDKREAAVIAFNPRFNHFVTADEDVVFWVPDPHN